MKCPKCQAKLLPVDGEMFCLQCGTAVMPKRGADISAPEIEETADPLLQKAIMDSFGHEVKFKLPVSGAPPAKATTAFVSMRQALAPSQLAMAGLATVGPAVRPAVGKSLGSRSAGGGASGRQRLELDRAVAGLARQMVRGIVAIRGLSKAWMAGLAVFAVFLAVNGAIYAGLNGRVYPGVRVGTTELGGMTFSELHGKLTELAKPASLTVRVESVSFQYRIPATANAEQLAAVEEQAREAGHSTPLPLAGLLETLVSKALVLQPGVSSSTARAEAEQIAGQVTFAPTPATMMIVAGKVLLIADKPGQSLDVGKATSAIQGAYGKTSVVSLQLQKLQPVITVSDFSGEAEKAQAVLGQSVKVHVKSAVYQPTVAQIGDWLIVNGPGKGVAVNAAAVSSYVTELPGRFDRAGAVNAIVAAVTSGQSLDYTASTSKATTAPKLVNSIVWPLDTLGYCVGSGLSASDLQKVQSVLSDKSAWALGGRLSITQSKNSCNFSINIMPAEAMSRLDPGCKDQSTCLVGNDIAINESAWEAVPAKWSGTLDSYRTELVNHEVGHWLGFQHAACIGPTANATTPILAAPDLVLSGCSPNWYAIPVDQQRTKILPGFN